MTVEKTMQTDRKAARRLIAVPDYQPRISLYISQFIFLLGFFAKQFYIGDSGTVQAGDLLMMAGCGCYFLLTKKWRIDFDRHNRWFYLFFFGVFVVNTVYLYLTANKEFITATFFYLFNLIIIIIFTDMLKEPNRDVFLKWFGWTLKLALLFQGVVYLAGFGREDARYLGTFNDPNQFGVYIFFAMLMIFITDRMLGRKLWFVWDVIGTLVILPSASTGTMLGVVLFWVGMYFYFFREMSKIWKIVFGGITFMIVISILVFGLGAIELPKAVTSHFMYQRINEKFDEVWGKFDNLVSDRAWDRILEYPQYFLYGSGEGFNKRFDATDLELHSSILAPAFSYGIIPFSCLVYWALKKVLKSRFLFIYVALFSEAVFIVNTRQPMYWILILMAFVTPRLSRQEREEMEAEAADGGTYG